MLPKYFEPYKLIEQQAILAGTLNLQEMSRLSELTASESSRAVSVELKFGKKNGKQLIQGEISVDLDLICQRCGQEMVYKMRLPVNLVPVRTEEEAERLAKVYDPLVTEGEMVNLKEMVENEILVNLPMVPKHPEGECHLDLPKDIQLR